MDKARIIELLTDDALSETVAQALSDGVPGDEYDGLTYVAELKGPDPRWFRATTIVFSDPDGLLWSFTYDHGLVEDVDSEYSGVPASVTCVEARQITVTKYVPA